MPTPLNLSFLDEKNKQKLVPPAIKGFSENIALQRISENYNNESFAISPLTPIKSRASSESANKGLRALQRIFEKNDNRARLFKRWRNKTFANTTNRLRSANLSLNLEEAVFNRHYMSLNTSRSAITALATKRMDRSVEYAQMQSKAYLFKVGVNVLKRMFILQMTKAFYKLQERKSIKAVAAKYRDHLLKIFIKREELDMRKRVIDCFNKWRGHSISETFRKGRITNKIKGRLLLTLSKNKPRLDLTTAFLRWKIKSNASYLRKAANILAISSRINMHTSFWRLKALIAPKEDLVKKMRRFQKLRKSLIIIKAILDKQQKVTLNNGFHQIYKSSSLMALKMKCMRSLDKSVKRVLVQSLEKWKQACIYSIIMDLRRRAIKVLLKSNNHLKTALYRWRAAISEGGPSPKKMIKNGEGADKIFENCREAFKQNTILLFRARKEKKKRLKTMKYICLFKSINKYF